jgi:hypothetical protein
VLVKTASAFTSISPKTLVVLGMLKFIAVRPFPTTIFEFTLNFSLIKCSEAFKKEEQALSEKGREEVRKLVVENDRLLNGE